MEVKPKAVISQFEIKVGIDTNNTNECLSGKYNENGGLISPNGDISFETTLQNGTKMHGKIKIVHKSKLSDREGGFSFEVNLSCQHIWSDFSIEFLEIILSSDGGDSKERWQESSNAMFRNYAYHVVHTNNSLKVVKNNKTIIRNNNRIIKTTGITVINCCDSNDVNVFRNKRIKSFNGIFKFTLKPTRMSNFNEFIRNDRMEKIQNLISEDFTIKIDGESIGFNKYLLKNISSYFKTIVENDAYKEYIENSIDMEDCDLKTILTFKKFLIGQDLDISDLTPELIIFGDRYDIPLLGKSQTIIIEATVKTTQNKICETKKWE